jgi:hypothetical protein
VSLRAPLFLAGLVSLRAPLLLAGLVSLRAPLFLAGLALWLGCSGLAEQVVPRPAPVVQQRIFAVPAPGSLKRMAVMPFYPDPAMGRRVGEDEGGVSPAEASALVSRFLSEALAARGVDVIPASDLETAFAGRGTVTPRLDPRAAAELAAREFGATAVLLGEVSRYRERGGEAYGTTQSASVSFEVSLFAAPGAQRLRSARFDETQRPLSDNVLNAPRYPGGGTRWLSAAELARWGAGAAADALISP